MKKVIYILITLFSILMFSGCVGNIVQIKNLKDDVKAINYRLDSLQVELNKLIIRMDSIKNQSHK